MTEEEKTKYRILIVVDMQIDFVYETLGTKEARSIVPNIVDKINKYKDYETEDSNIRPIIFYTRDTHGKEYEYLATEEGKNLPIPHCQENTHGWQLILPIQELSPKNIINKTTFGSLELANKLKVIESYSLIDNCDIESVELVGVCTDICVISNAFIVKAALPNTPIYVDASCCAGTTVESHKRALESMKTCHIHILNYNMNTTLKHKVGDNVKILRQFSFGRNYISAIIIDINSDDTYKIRATTIENNVITINGLNDNCLEDIED